MNFYKKIYLVGTVFFSFIIATLVFNITYQLFQIRKINTKKCSLLNEIKGLEKELEFYDKEVKKLSTNEGIEEYARKKLGMIKIGERLYKLVGDKDDKENRK